MNLCVQKTMYMFINNNINDDIYHLKLIFYVIVKSDMMLHQMQREIYKNWWTMLRE